MISAERTRLASVLGLLASPHPGEVAAAAAAATRLLAKAGLTWPDLLMPPTPKLTPSGAGADRAVLEASCRRYAGLLTAWECGFLDSIARRRVLTRKQHATLSKIAGELPRRAAP